MGIVAGFMVPHPPLAVHEVGRGREYEIQDTLDAYAAVADKIAELKPDTIIITSPHSVMYRDYFHISPGERAVGDFSDFGVSSVSFSEMYDSELVSLIEKECDSLKFPAGTDGEWKPALDHGTMVPLYFIRQKYIDYRLIRCGLSGLPLAKHFKLGQIMAKSADILDRRVVFVASGDLSHCQKYDGPYGYKPEGPVYDERLMDVMGRGAFEELFEFDDGLLDAAEECGHRSFCIMAGAFDGLKYTSKALSHEATFGVGYGIAEYIVD